MHLLLTKKVLVTLWLSLALQQRITANKVKMFSARYTTDELFMSLKRYGTFDSIIDSDNNLYESQFLNI